jgi:FdhE protein
VTRFSFHEQREQWMDLLERRPTFRDALLPYQNLLDGWALWPANVLSPLSWSAVQCRDRWGRGVPLLEDAAPDLALDVIEPLMGQAMDAIARVVPEKSASLQRLAEAWDRGEIAPSALFPRPGGAEAAAAEQAYSLPRGTFGVLAAGALRPALQDYFAACHPHLADSDWEQGSCPFCGAAPSAGDLVETGQRRLACHVCGGTWGFARHRCPFCGTVESKDLARLDPDGAEEGYRVSACGRCGGYLKEIDRRVRWNAVSALLEDWGTPHLDVVATRAGYRRPLPTLLQLGHPG